MSTRRQVVATVVPMVVTLLACVVGAGMVWSVRDELPTRIATHWGVRGNPDAFSTTCRLSPLAHGLATLAEDFGTDYGSKPFT